MPSHTRRAFLKGSSAALGLAIASGRPAVATTGDERREYIVKRDGRSDRYFERAGLEVDRRIESLGLLTVRGPESTVDEVTQWFAPDLRIERRRGYPLASERSDVPAMSNAATAAEDWYPVQWNKRIQQIRAIHEVAQGEGARVAIIDSGIHTEHPDFANGVVNEDLSENFTDDRYGTGKAYGDSHGTAVGSFVAGNGTYVLGSAPEAELVDCRVFSIESEFTRTSWYLDALGHAIEVGCDVVNLSLGPGVTVPVRSNTLETVRRSEALEQAREAGVLVTTSTGNEALDLRRYPLYKFEPSSNLVNVSATGPLGFGWPIDDSTGDGFSDPSELEQPLRLQAPPYELAPYSSYGKGIVDISAPGGNVGSFRTGAVPEGYYLDMTPHSYVGVQFDGSDFEFNSMGLDWSVGTSFAAPEVAGAAALLKGRYPDATAEQLKAELQRAALDVGRESPDPLHGAGFLNPAPLFLDG